jgi:hypothetical protein
MVLAYNVGIIIPMGVSDLLKVQEDIGWSVVIIYILVDFQCYHYSMVHNYIQIDSAYIVEGDGGTPQLTADIISNYSKTYRYK